MFKPFRKITLCLLLAAGAVTASAPISRALQNTVQKIDQEVWAVGARAVDSAEDLLEAGGALGDRLTQNTVTFLVTGIDSALGGSDVIMLVTLEAHTGDVRILQIPRDTYINRPGSRHHKLNSVYATAAADARNRGQDAKEAAHTANRALLSFLERSFGVEIHHYLSIDTKGLRALVDAVGGIKLTVPMDIDYDDNSQNLHIHLAAGEQVLNGAAAEQFVRYRSGYQTADYGRMDAQKIFLSALFQKLRSDLSLPEVLQVTSACYRHLICDLSAADLMPLIRAGLQTSAERIRMITLKGISAKDEEGVLCEVIPRRYAIDMICAYLLPRGAGSDDLIFDPDGVFTAPGKIDEIYQGEAPFSKEGISADQADRICPR